MPKLTDAEIAERDSHIAELRDHTDAINDAIETADTAGDDGEEEDEEADADDVRRSYEMAAVGIDAYFRALKENGRDKENATEAAKAAVEAAGGVWEAAA